jgi:hypothetical protein
LVSASFATATEAAPPDWTRPPPDFRQMPALPRVRQAAVATQTPLAGLAVGADDSGLAPGDGVTVLVTHTEGGELKQWIVAIEAVAPTEKEKKAPERGARFFSSSGYEFRFGSTRAVLELKVVGPLGPGEAGAKAKTPEVKRRRVGVGADFLGLGLDRVPATYLRAKAIRAGNPELPPGQLQIGNRPFPPELAGERRRAAEAAGYTEADERAMIGGVLALLEFFQITLRTPGLQDVLKSVLDLPWWSIVTSGGKMPAMNFDGLSFARELAAETWGLPATEKVYASPYLLRLNGEPALLFQLAVTAPRPPLRVSAGIVGLAAGRPDGKGPVLTLQVVASHRAPVSTAP